MRSQPSIPSLIKYAVNRAIRQVYVRYHPARQQAIEAARVEVPLRNKDGSVSKRCRVYYKCAHCGELVDKVEVDHVDPCGTIPDPTIAGELEAWIKRLFCEVANLNVLCIKCHKEKSNHEKRTKAYRKTN